MDPFVFKIVLVTLLMIAQGVLWVAVWFLWRLRVPQVTPYDMFKEPPSEEPYPSRRR
ncbi:MAG: hypothetical protein MI924_31600 [Chloroflexales bacterium]|nr:hypothetical protein [Chloroflexales bacterium]